VHVIEDVTDQNPPTFNESCTSINIWGAVPILEDFGCC